MKHIVAVIILIAVITVAAWAWVGGNFEQMLPLRASEEGAYIDRLFSMHLHVIAFLFALIVGFMLYSIIVFRRKSGDESDGDYFHGNTALEIVWTIIPLGIVLYFAGLGAQYLREITAPDPDELVVEVTASQWNWRFDYPDYGIGSAELVLPQGRQVLFKLVSLDVIHDFWVPEFRAKQDAVPGQVKPLRITPTETGQFTLRCAEMCGRGHAYMLADVTVMTAADFDAWVAEQTGAPAGDLAEVGAQVAELNGCTACHSADGGESVGPTWLGLFGSEEILDDGTTVAVDGAYIRTAILDPGAQVVQGFANIMPPTFGDVLSDEDVDALVAYIESLGD